MSLLTNSIGPIQNLSSKMKRIKIPRDFEIQADHQILARRPVLINNNEKKTCQLVDYIFPADHREKMREGEKLDNYLDLAKELRI